MVGMRLFFTVGLAASSAAAQGFWTNCTRWDLGFENATSYRNFMVAECTDGEGELRTSFLSLNDCLANHEGELVGVPNGGFQPTCQKCTTRNSSLTCECKPTWGGPKPTTIDLDTVISNVDGIISCFNFMGVEIDDFDSSPA